MKKQGVEGTIRGREREIERKLRAKGKLQKKFSKELIQMSIIY